MTKDANTARERILVDGLGDWVELYLVHWNVKQDNPDASVRVIQSKTLDLIRTLLNEGLFEIGTVEKGHGFLPWSTTTEESIDRLTRVYVDGFEDESFWEYYAWLNLTETGEKIARPLFEAGRSST